MKHRPDQPYGTFDAKTVKAVREISGFGMQELATAFRRAQERYGGDLLAGVGWLDARGLAVCVRGMDRDDWNDMKAREWADRVRDKTIWRVAFGLERCQIDVAVEQLWQDDALIRDAISASRSWTFDLDIQFLAQAQSLRQSLSPSSRAAIDAVPEAVSDAFMLSILTDEWSRRHNKYQVFEYQNRYRPDLANQDLAIETASTDPSP